MKPNRNKIILLLTLLFYLFINISQKEWNIYLFQGILFSIFGVYDIITLCIPLSGFLGIGITLYCLITKKIIIIYRSKLLLTGLILLTIPLFYFHTYDNIRIEISRGLYLFIPEIFFLIGFIYLLKKILSRKSNTMSENMNRENL